MCGILGSIPAINSDIFKKSLDLLNHRGPDDEGILNLGSSISLGHKRLAILDLSEKGKQPMSRYGRFHIVFNGEIYNFLEIRNDLQKKGYKFYSKSDTEVLLYSFIEWGHDCVNKFNGMWAFAIWNSEENTLFISRDRLGEKPLYYSFENNNFLFASEQKALLPLLNEVKVSSNFKNLVQNPYLSTKETLFSKIYKFPAGSSGLLKDNIFSIKRYWTPEINNEIYLCNYKDQLEYLNELILDSCKIRLRSDVPISTALSGGIDSSTVASYVKDIYQGDFNFNKNSKKQTGFNLSFPNSVMDENYFSKMIADKLNINLTTVIPEPKLMSNNLEKVCYLFEDIQEVNPLPHFYLYKSIKDNGFTVSLDGHGGDELFCGYESSVLHALKDNIFDYKCIKDIYKIYSEIHPKNKYFKKMNLPRIFLYLLKENLRNNYLNNRHQKMSEVYSNLDSLSKHLFVLTFETVLPTLLRNYDRYSMMNGVEIRMPLLDYRIVNFAFSIPWQSKLNKGFTKIILRDQLKNKIPESIVQNKVKIGFSPPINDWMKGPLKEYILDEINSSLFRNSTLINAPKLKAKINNLILGDTNYSHYYSESIWKEFSTYIWEKLFLN